MYKYLWQNPDWPDFKWDSQILIQPLTTLITNQGLLKGKMELLGFKVKSESIINRFTSEITKSYEIEGADLSLNSVRSSVARKLGLENVILSNGDVLETPKQSIDSVVNVIFDAVQNCNTLLTKERLCQWNSQLFGNVNQSFNGGEKINVGQYRTDKIYVISGTMGNAKIHYEAPPANIVNQEMDKFLKWFNTPMKELKINSILKSAIAHLYFVSIHPFEDGNGRISRAIADMALSQNQEIDLTNKDINNNAEEPKYDHLYSMSAQLCKERKDYYNELEKAQTSGLDITSWLLWYIECMNRAVLSSLNELNLVIKRKHFWERCLRSI